jgi:hypothetical protein
MVPVRTVGVAVPMRTVGVAAALGLVWLTGLAAWGVAGGDELKGIQIDKDKKIVYVDAKVAPRKLEHLKGEIYPIEVVASLPYPAGKKAHETVVTIEAKPSDVHRALVSLGLQPGAPIFGDSKDKARGPEIRIGVDVKQPDGTSKRIPLERLMVDIKTNKQFPKGVKFFFTGSVEVQPDPTKPDKVYGADDTGTLIAIFPVTDKTVLQSSLTMAEEKYLKLEVNKQVLPAEGTPVKLVLEVVGR